MNLTKGAVLINGQWYDGGGECFPVQNPSTNETLTIINFADEAQVNLAIQSAKEAFISWKKSTVKTRSELLTKIADAVEKNTEQLI
jgi:acyl-CoA reductase-like NAD-dependent aldehyde dehydrogenase